MCHSNCEGIFVDEYFPNWILLLFADNIAQCAELVGRLQNQLINVANY